MFLAGDSLSLPRMHCAAYSLSRTGTTRFHVPTLHLVAPAALLQAVIVLSCLIGNHLAVTS